jgi:hypothetical protein
LKYKAFLIETNRIINDVINSEEYKLLAARNRAWATPKSIYKSEMKLDDATFGGCDGSAQFKNRRPIVDHFSLKANNTTNADRGNLGDFLSEDEWIYLS